MPEFPTTYSEILERLQSIDPAAYASTRNYLRGAVTRLSPYLTHGVLSTREVGRVALQKVSPKKAEVLLRELAWRDFYQASWDSLGDAIFADLRYPQPFAAHRALPTAVEQANTGIAAIDEAIQQLYQTGYVHNHARMWLAMLCCNVARTAWWSPSQWMYYHLLDGDIASNTLSWQWVAGSSRQEPYLANQENINSFSGTTQHGSYLDVPYTELTRGIPEQLQERSSRVLSTNLATTPLPSVSDEVLLYHPWSLSPTWHQSSSQPRILLLEPDHFARFPVSPQRLSFIKALAANIPNLTIAAASFSQLQQANPTTQFRYKAHPSIKHWSGITEPAEPLFSASTSVQKNWSFSKFWSLASCTLSEDEYPQGD